MIKNKYLDGRLESLYTPQDIIISETDELIEILQDAYPKFKDIFENHKSWIEKQGFIRKRNYRVTTRKRIKSLLSLVKSIKSNTFNGTRLYE